MRTNKLLVGVIFLVGCVTGGVGAQLVVPPARAGTTGPRWDYFCFNESMLAEQVASRLQEAGAQGWELATTSTASNGGYSLYCMKRPAGAAASAP